MRKNMRKKMRKKMSKKMLHTNFFNYNKDTKVLSAEVSKLEPLGFEPCEHFFTLISDHTGAKIGFKLSELKYEHEGDNEYSRGDFQSWIFIPVKPTPNVTKLIIWND